MQNDDLVNFMTKIRDAADFFTFIRDETRELAKNLQELNGNLKRINSELSELNVKEMINPKTDNSLQIPMSALNENKV